MFTKGKNIRKIFTAAVIFVLCLMIAGCSDKTDSEKTQTLPTYEEGHEYTAVELARYDLNGIISIMGGEYDEEKAQFTEAFSSDGCLYVYNETVLPGFAFAKQDDDYYGISVSKGAKLNDEISSDMTYNEVIKTTMEMEGSVAGSGNCIFCSTTLDGYPVTFCFENSESIKDKTEGGRVSSDVLKECDPALDSIGLRKINTGKQ